MVWIILLVAAIAAAGIYIFYRQELRAIEDRVAAGSQIIDTSHGPVEFAEWGSEPPALIVHGAGGGYDQGRFMAEAYGGDGFHWIAPSRFGYLRTPLPSDASTAAQADAFAELLDDRGIDRIALVAVSGGVPPALKFAERYPDRAIALVLISSAPFTSFMPEEQELPVPAWAYQLLFSSNVPYWLMQKLARPTLAALYDVKPTLRTELTPDEEATVEVLIDRFQPVARRTDGLANEAAAIDPDARYSLAKIVAPTLVIHARDDGVNPFSIGAHLAEHIPGAAFVAVDSGGHLLLRHHAEVRERVSAFLREHAGGASR